MRAGESFIRESFPGFSLIKADHYRYWHGILEREEAIDFVVRYDAEPEVVIEGTYLYDEYIGANGHPLRNTPFSPTESTPEQVRSLAEEWVAHVPDARLALDTSSDRRIQRLDEDGMKWITRADYSPAVGQRWAESRGLSLADVYLMWTTAQEHHVVARKADGTGWVYVGTSDELIQQMGYEVPK